MNNNNGLLLWVDDEIELLKAYIIFLEKKGYEVVTVSNGADAIDQCRAQTFDLVLLDEQMPGLSGLETLQRIKEIQPATPIVMVTKSEEENIMEQAIGSKIADYLIKPVNPSQILLTLKKNIHRKEIVTEVTQTGYQQDYQQISMQISDCRSFADWAEVYKRLVRWELELSSTESNMTDMLKMQKEEANIGFAKYIQQNYLDWVAPQQPARTDRFQLRGRKEEKPGASRPTMSPDLFDIDEQVYLSILPTATQYARNAIFSGLMPQQIAKMFPELWVDEDEEEGKNLNEKPLIQTQIDRYRRHDKFSYHKINDSADSDKYLSQFNNLYQNDLNVLVINFIDILSHARTEMKMIRELANNESAYRSITRSWFRHSVLTDLLRLLSQSDYKVIITTDHGSIRTTKPVKIVGDRNTNTNLRYKLGKNLSYHGKDLFVIKNPHLAQLPAPNLSTAYVFATGDAFFAYPNNYNYYVSYYKDTFQHGGISMEEMIVPLITLTPRKR